VVLYKQDILVIENFLFNLDWVFAFSLIDEKKNPGHLSVTGILLR